MPALRKSVRSTARAVDGVVDTPRVHLRLAVDRPIEHNPTVRELKDGQQLGCGRLHADAESIASQIMIHTLRPLLLGAAPPALAPIRIIASIALVVVIGIFIYVLRHLKKIERAIVADDLVPANRGPRNNMIFIACAVTFVIVSLLLFLIIKA